MSDELDSPDLLGEPSAQEQAAAYAAALRRQAFTGGLAHLLGNKGLSDFGTSVTQTAQHEADALDRSQQRAAQQASLNTWRRRPVKLGNGQTGVWDPETGKMEIVAQAAPKVMRAGDGSTISVGEDNAVTQLVKAPPPRKSASALLGGGAISDAALDMLADQAHTEGHLPTQKALAPHLPAILERIVQRHPGSDLAAAHAGYGADAGSLKSLQKQNDAMEAYERTAGANLNTFLTQAQKIKDTGSPLFNKSVRWMDSNLAGNPEMAAFNAARQTAVQEIGKLLSGSTGAGGISDSARHEVEGLIGPDATLAQIAAAANILKQDMGNRHSAMKAQLDEMRGRASSHPKAVAPAAAAGGSDVVTIRRKTDGKTKTLPAGAAARYLADPAYEKVE